MHQLSSFFFTVETYPVLSWSQVGWWWGGEGRGVHRAYPPVIFRSPSADIPASGRLPFPSVNKQQVKLKLSGDRVVTGSQQNPSRNFLLLHARKGRRHGGRFSRGVHLNTNGSSNRGDKIIDPSPQTKAWMNN